MRYESYQRANAIEMRLASYLSRLGARQARERAKYRGWICGTGSHNIRLITAKILHEKYSPLELELLGHLFEIFDDNKTRSEVLEEANKNNIDILDIEMYVLNNLVHRPVVHPLDPIDFLD